ncbi:MAG: hypothetical protein Q8S43_09065 [Actinomycetota bacterium]|nr:MAG: hypothetical protein FD171_1303 [Actinomycetota bacterium]MDO8949829.1 hypothetical protein [Actinomycetota bacterium]MDP3631079.1 hypothetical protein [Actinomycetota bacterium]
MRIPYLVRAVLVFLVVGLLTASLAGCINETDTEVKERKEREVVQDRLAAEIDRRKFNSSKSETGDTAFSEDTSATSDTATQPGELFMVGNDQEVFGGGRPTTVELRESSTVTEVWTYHWNGGAGAPAGTITLTAADGTVYGPWKATALNKVYWVAKPNVVLPAGAYTVTDSDPGTWAQNAGTGGQGHTWAKGSASK